MAVLQSQSTCPPPFPLPPRHLLRLVVLLAASLPPRLLPVQLPLALRQEVLLANMSSVAERIGLERRLVRVRVLVLSRMSFILSASD